MAPRALICSRPRLDTDILGTPEALRLPRRSRSGHGGRIDLRTHWNSRVAFPTEQDVRPARRPVLRLVIAARLLLVA